MSDNQKKFLDQKGVEHLWSKINMQDYPNNETLMTVINAIDETKADKSELIPTIPQREEKTIVFNGETEGLEVFNNYFYKVSDDIVSLEDVAGGYYFKIGTPDSDETTILTFDELNEGGHIFPSSTGSGYNVNNFVLLVTKETENGPTPGIYFEWAEWGCAKEMTYSITKEVIDPSYIPDSFATDDEVQLIKNNVAFISEEDGEDIIIETKSPYAGTIHRFTVEVNCAPMYILEDNLGPEFADAYQPYTDYGVLVFPDSYTDTGKKTRLVISAHGGGGTVTADSSQAEFQSISRYLVANGYAVMDVNGLPEQYALEHGNLRLQDSVGSYIAIQSHIKAYNYAMDNFNFYPEVFLVGISEGGITTTNIVLHSHIPVLAQAGWSPVLDTYNQIWMDPWPWCSVNGPGAVLATVYGFDPIPDATSTKDREKWTYDEKKLMGYNPMKCNVTTGADGLEYRHYRCPVKFWHCMDDDTVRYEPTEAFIKSIQNAGGTAYLKLYETGGHETAYVGDPVPNPIGNTIAYDGTEIEIKPVCEETFLFFKRFE